MAKHSRRAGATTRQMENGGLDLSAWRAQRQAGHPRTLPSGLRVILRGVKLIDLIVAGEIPQTLDALVKKASTEGFGVSDVQEFLPLVNAVTRAALMDPAIADTADETHLTLDEVPIEDRLDIFMWANGGAEAVRPFPAEPPGFVEPA